jgi:c-di-GMP-binding flagellar brake protein YcgR
MKISDISKGADITVIASFQDKKIVFESTVMLSSGNILLIPPIKHNNKTIGFNHNFMIDVHYVEDGKLYRFPDVELSLVRYGHTLFHKITTDHDGTIYNRRGDYRLYIGQDMHAIINRADGPVDIKVTLKDISLSGFAFISKEELDVGRTVRLKFVDDRFRLNLPAKIIRMDFNEHLNSTLYGCKISESFPALGQYLIQKQREILKRTRAATTGGH